MSDDTQHQSSEDPPAAEADGTLSDDELARVDGAGMNGSIMHPPFPTHDGPPPVLGGEDLRRLLGGG